MTAPAGISLQGLSAGDHVSAHYTREVTFVVGTPDASTPRATQTVGQTARAPGGIGAGASVIVGRVIKVDGPGAFDIVNVDGGGEYTVRSTDPTRVAALRAVKAGMGDCVGRPCHADLARPLQPVRPDLLSLSRVPGGDAWTGSVEADASRREPVEFLQLQRAATS